jgi:hypothetical protein
MQNWDDCPICLYLWPVDSRPTNHAYLLWDNDVPCSHSQRRPAPIFREHGGIRSLWSENTYIVYTLWESPWHERVDHCLYDTSSTPLGAYSRAHNNAWAREYAPSGVELVSYKQWSTRSCQGDSHNDIMYNVYSLYIMGITLAWTCRSLLIRH